MGKRGGKEKRCKGGEDMSREAPKDGVGRADAWVFEDLAEDSLLAISDWGGAKGQSRGPCAGVGARGRG